jgi:hypothetical protein
VAFLFRIAIWNRNVFVTLLLLGTSLANLPLYIYGKLRIRYPPVGCSCLLTCCWTYEALVEVRNFSADPFSELSDLSKSRKTCVLILEKSTSNTRTGSFLISSVSTLVTDGVLLISMLIGLMRSPQSSSFGLWHLLYQQVVAYFSLESPLILDVFQVLHLVSLGDDCGGSTYGVWILSL